MRVAMIDNYDSFTYNLVQAFLVLGADVRVHRNDEITMAAGFCAISSAGSKASLRTTTTGREASRSICCTRL